MLDFIANHWLIISLIMGVFYSVLMIIEKRSGK